MIGLDHLKGEEGDRGFLILPWLYWLPGHPDIRFRVIIAWLSSLSWAGYIMNMELRKLLLENQEIGKTLLATFFAEHNASRMTMRSR